MKRPSVAVLGLWHETNTFVSKPTTLDDFEEFELLGGDELAEANLDVGSVIGGFLDSADLDLQMCFSAGAWPAGPVSADAREEILSRSLDALDAVGSIDGVLLNLHGAMVAEDDDDPELTLVREIRRLQPEVPLAAVLDLHANPSPELVALCNVVISYDTYPHVDMRARGREAGAMLTAMLRTQRHLQTLVAKIPFLASPLAQATAAEPMGGLIARGAARCREAGLDRVSVAGGYAYSDVTRAGISVLVVYERDASDAAKSVLRETAHDVEENAELFVLHRDGVEVAVRRALRSQSTPVVLVDVADNVGGGSAGDGTAILSELLHQGCRSALLVISDPEVVAAAATIGVGGTFRGALGGKRDDLHGPPVEVVGKVVRLSDGRYRTEGSWMTGRSFEMGPTAVLDINGVTVVVTTRRVPPFHREQVTSLGLEPGSCKGKEDKGAHPWRPPVGDVAGDVIEVDSPGVCPLDPYAAPRRAVPCRFP